MRPGARVPRGIEVLLKKARVDSEFRVAVRDDPLAAARSIGLDLSPSEQSILNAVPREDLLAMAERVEVSEVHRSVFRGKVAAAMLAVVSGASAIGCGGQPSGFAPSPAFENEPLEWSVGMVQFGITIEGERVDWGDQVEDE